jgi:hypothetical protein
MPGLNRPEDILEGFALYFDWSNKILREVGLVHLLSQAMARTGEEPYWSIAPARRDPPDCTALCGTGTPVAIEVTEFVSEETIRCFHRGGEQYRQWKAVEVCERLEYIVQRKDTKIYRGGPYQEVVLLIYTAEPNITYDDYRAALMNYHFSATAQIDKVYLLFPFDYRQGCCPYLRLKVVGQKNVEPGRMYLPGGSQPHTKQRPLASITQRPTGGAVPKG